MEIHSTSLREIHEGNFPLNHDCILEVVYFPASGLSRQFFSCPAQYSGSIVLILSQVFCVKIVKVHSVDNFCL